MTIQTLSLIIAGAAAAVATIYAFFRKSMEVKEMREAKARRDAEEIASLRKSIQDSRRNTCSSSSEDSGMVFNPETGRYEIHVNSSPRVTDVVKVIHENRTPITQTIYPQGYNPVPYQSSQINYQPAYNPGTVSYGWGNDQPPQYSMNSYGGGYNHYNGYPSMSQPVSQYNSGGYGYGWGPNSNSYAERMVL